MNKCTNWKNYVESRRESDWNPPPPPKKSVRVTFLWHSANYMAVILDFSQRYFAGTTSDISGELWPWIRVWQVMTVILNKPSNLQSQSYDIYEPMISANIRSVLPKINELQAIAVTNDLSFCLMETWLNTYIPDSARGLAGYICLGNGCCYAIYGVVCIYIKSVHPCGILA